MSGTTEPKPVSTDSGAQSGDHDDRSESGWSELSLYLAAAIIYIAIGFVRQEVFAWWIYGAAWFVAVIWFGPPLVRRVMKRLRPKTQAERDST